MLDYSRYQTADVSPPTTQRDTASRPVPPQPAHVPPLDALNAPPTDYDDWQTGAMQPPVRKHRHIPPFEALSRSWWQSTPDEPAASAPEAAAT